jgi:flagellar FliL protein
MKFILPLVLTLLGLGLGGGAGWLLRPAPVETEDAQGGAPPAPAPRAMVATETMRLSNQFIIPLIEDGRVRAMVVIGLALEVAAGHEVNLVRDEPKLRSIFLQQLFDYANLGGFDGVFTSGEALAGLRRSLRESARAELGPALHDVLITELVRQDN